jgi:hypothetical protein
VSGIPMMLLASSGGAGVINPIPAPSASAFELNPTDATCSIIFDTDGDGTTTSSSAADVPFNWHTSAPTVGIGAGFWLRFTLNSGNAATGGSAVGVWHQLSTARSLSMTEAGLGTRTGNFTVEIATDSGGANIVGSDTFSLTSSSEL